MQQVLATTMEAFVTDGLKPAIEQKRQYDREAMDYDAMITKHKNLKKTGKATPAKEKESEQQLDATREEYLVTEKSTMELLKQCGTKGEMLTIVKLIEYWEAMHAYFKDGVKFLDTMQPKVERYRRHIRDMTRAATSAAVLSPRSDNRTFKIPLQKLCEREQRRVPQIVVACCNYLKENGLETTGIFRVSPTKDSLDDLKAEIDQGRSFDFSDINNPHIISGLLKAFLRETPDPIFTFERYPKFMEASKLETTDEQVAAIDELLKSLPVHNYKVLQHVSLLCRLIEARKEDNKMTISNLATVLTPNMLYTSTMDPINMVQEMEQANRIYSIIVEHYDTLFPTDDLDLDAVILTPKADSSAGMEDSNGETSSSSFSFTGTPPSFRLSTSELTTSSAGPSSPRERAPTPPRSPKLRPRVDSTPSPRTTSSINLASSAEIDNSEGSLDGESATAKKAKRSKGSTSSLKISASSREPSSSDIPNSPKDGNDTDGEGTPRRPKTPRSARSKRTLKADSISSGTAPAGDGSSVSAVESLRRTVSHRQTISEGSNKSDDDSSNLKSASSTELRRPKKKKVSVSISGGAAASSNADADAQQFSDVENTPRSPPVSPKATAATGVGVATATVETGAEDQNGEPSSISASAVAVAVVAVAPSTDEAVAAAKEVAASTSATNDTGSSSSSISASASTATPTHSDEQPSSATNEVNSGGDSSIGVKASDSEPSTTGDDVSVAAAPASDEKSTSQGVSDAGVTSSHSNATEIENAASNNDHGASQSKPENVADPASSSVDSIANTASSSDIDTESIPPPPGPEPEDVSSENTLAAPETATLPETQLHAPSDDELPPPPPSEPEIDATPTPNPINNDSISDEGNSSSEEGDPLEGLVDDDIPLVLPDPSEFATILLDPSIQSLIDALVGMGRAASDESLNAVSEDDSDSDGPTYIGIAQLSQATRELAAQAKSLSSEAALFVGNYPEAEATIGTSMTSVQTMLRDLIIAVKDVSASPTEDAPRSELRCVIGSYARNVMTFLQALSASSTQQLLLSVQGAVKRASGQIAPTVRALLSTGLDEPFATVKASMMKEVTQIQGLASLIEAQLQTSLVNLETLHQALQAVPDAAATFWSTAAATNDSADASEMSQALVQDAKAFIAALREVETALTECIEADSVPSTSELVTALTLALDDFSARVFHGTTTDISTRLLLASAKRTTKVYVQKMRSAVQHLSNVANSGFASAGDHLETANIILELVDTANRLLSYVKYHRVDSPSNQKEALLEANTSAVMICLARLRLVSCFNDENPDSAPEVEKPAILLSLILRLSTSIHNAIFE